MNREQNRRQKRLVRHKASRKQKRRISDMKPNQGMTPFCKSVLARNRDRLLQEGKAQKATRSTSGIQKQDKSLQRAMVSG